MRLRPLVAATAAVLLLQSPAIAAPAKPAPAKAAAKPVKAVKPVKPEPEAMRLMRLVGNELTAAIDTKAHPGVQMEQLKAMKFTPATSALLVKYIGTDKLVDFTKVTHADGSSTFQYWTPNVDQKLEGGNLKAAPLRGDMKVDAAGNAYSTTAVMESITFGDNKMTFGADKLSMAAELKRGPHDFWMGTMWYAIDAISLTPAGKPSPVFVMAGMRADVASTHQGDVGAFTIDGIIKSITVMGQDAGAIKSRMRLTGMDLATLRKLTDETAANAKAGKKPKMDEEQLHALFATFAQNGASMHLDEFSWSFKGQDLVLKGTIGFAPGTKGKDLQDTLKQAEGKLNVRIPVAMIKEIARTVAANMPMGQPGQPVSEQQREQHAATFADMAIGKMLGGGFFRMDGEVLVSDIAFKGGKMSLNGKEVDLPKPPQAAAAPAKPKQ